MRNFRRQTGLAMAALLVSALIISPSFAAETGGNPATKFTRGLVNVVTGWLEIPVQMAEQKKSDDTKVWWFFHGLKRGFEQGMARTAYGIWDMLTCPVAPYNAPYIEPDTLITPKPKPSSESGPPAAP